MSIIIIVIMNTIIMNIIIIIKIKWSNQKVLLHAFSGRRRRGDMEWFLDALGPGHSGCIISVLS